ncbi:MAG: hypothetical protein HYY06_24760 [Deltaproteobacteria bacterium]|nr:hypothetical protein [Deltaproteobacteria bacterium]
MRTASLFAVAITLSTPALAFHGGHTFERSANEGGGGGMFFDGSPRFKGYTCAVCHVRTCESCHGDDPEDKDEGGDEDDEALRVEVTSDPGELIRDRRYSPGETYAMRVRLKGEHLGMHSRSRIRTFVAELDTDDGQPVGDYSFDEREILAWDGGRVIAGRGIEDEREWTFEVTMPEAGAGRLTLWLSAVASISGRDEDVVRAVGPLDDAVAAYSRSFCEGDQRCDRGPERRAPASSPAGCSVAVGGGLAGASPLALVVFVLGLVARRRRPAVRAVAVALAIVMGSCWDPTTSAECHNAICGDSGTQTGPDPPLDECALAACGSDLECREGCPPAPEGWTACCDQEHGCVFEHEACP